MKNAKDVITNVVAIISVIGGSVNAYLQSAAGADINWAQLGTAVIVGVVAWFTGKNANGSVKQL